RGGGGPPADATALAKYVEQCLAAGNFRNLNNAQATGAQRMMTGRCEELRLACAELARVPGEAGRKPLLAMLDSPYPYAHYLAAKALGERGEAEVVPVLLGKLEVYLKAKDTVGFWWCCEALAALKAKDALPVLVRYATVTNPANTFGPEGMPVGYPAARALARIAADP